MQLATSFGFRRFKYEYGNACDVRCCAFGQLDLSGWIQDGGRNNKRRRQVVSLAKHSMKNR